MYLTNLSRALSARFERVGELGDLDGAIAVGRKAIAIAPASHANRAKYLAALAGVLMQRAERPGKAHEPDEVTSALERVRADLDEAVGLYRQATETTRPGHTLRAVCLSNLGEALRLRFLRTVRPRDADEAIAVCRDAVLCSSAAGADRAISLSNLGDALWMRAEYRLNMAGVLTRFGLAEAGRVRADQG
nr:hypothetical protein [Micromonospora sp. DSM 115978]